MSTCSYAVATYELHAHILFPWDITSQLSRLLYLFSLLSSTATYFRILDCGLVHYYQQVESKDKPNQHIHTSQFRRYMNTTPPSVIKKLCTAYAFPYYGLSGGSE